MVKPIKQQTTIRIYIIINYMNVFAYTYRSMFVQSFPPSADPAGLVFGYSFVYWWNLVASVHPCSRPLDSHLVDSLETAAAVAFAVASKAAVGCTEVARCCTDSAWYSE